MSRTSLTCRLCTSAAVTNFAVSLSHGAMAEAGGIQTPSGQGVEFIQKIEAESVGNTSDLNEKSIHFRFVAPTLSRDQSYETVSQDLLYLCNSFAVPHLEAASGEMTSEVVISLAKAPSEFGELTPDIPKFFESFVVTNGACDWGDY